jgi:hypothetical protein
MQRHRREHVSGEFAASHHRDAARGEERPRALREIAARAVLEREHPRGRGAVAAVVGEAMDAREAGRGDPARGAALTIGNAGGTRSRAATAAADPAGEKRQAVRSTRGIHPPSRAAQSACTRGKRVEENRRRPARGRVQSARRSCYARTTRGTAAIVTLA